MKLPISTFFTLLVIAFAGSSRAQGEEDRNLQAEDVFHSFLSAFTDSDVDGIVNLFSEDAIFWGTGTPLHSTPLHSASAWHFLYKMEFGRLYSSIIRQCPDRKFN